MMLFAISWLFQTRIGDLSSFNENLAILARVSVFPYLYMFMLGILLQRNKRVLRPFIEGKGIYWLLTYVCVAYSLHHAFAIPERTNTPNLLSMTLLATAVVSLAFTRRGLSERMLRGNDISYGTYVYHMVVANLAFQLGYRGTVSALAAALVASFGMAILSWFLIEKPALGLKRKALVVR